MASDSAFTTLLENIDVNLRDATRHGSGATIGDLADLKNNASHGGKYVSGALVPIAGHPTPYALVRPGPMAQDGEQLRTGTHTIHVDIIHRDFQDTNDYYTMLGDGSDDGLLTLAREIRRALDRPHPYNDGLHITANGYTTQTNVVFLACDGWDAPTPEPTPEGVLLVQTLNFTAQVEEARV